MRTMESVCCEERVECLGRMKKEEVRKTPGQEKKRWNTSLWVIRREFSWAMRLFVMNIAYSGDMS